MTLRILVDANACRVKDETYKVAWRRNVPVTIVANSFIRIPDQPLIGREVVSDGFDAARGRLDRGVWRDRRRWSSPPTSCSPIAASRPARP